MSPKIPETTVLISDLEDVYTTLLSVQTYLEAQDTAKSQLNYFESVRYSPLTQDVQQRVQRVKGLLDDHILREHRTSAPAPSVAPQQVPEEERLEPLPAHPMGAFNIDRPPVLVDKDAERVG